MITLAELKAKYVTECVGGTIIVTEPNGRRFDAARLTAGGMVLTNDGLKLVSGDPVAVLMASPAPEAPVETDLEVLAEMAAAEAAAAVAKSKAAIAALKAKKAADKKDEEAAQVALDEAIARAAEAKALAELEELTKPD